MANVLKIRKVNTLPGTYDPSTLYLVKSASSGKFDIHLSSSDGLTIRHIITEAEIQTMINNALGSSNASEIVANIAQRDALNPTKNIQVFVLDATGDPTVSSGAATYIYNYNTTTWHKISEFESLDLIVNWNNMINKPTSSASDIDDAVTKKHNHSNKAQLDKIGEDANGLLLYNGNNIRAYLETDEW